MGNEKSIPANVYPTGYVDPEAYAPMGGTRLNDDNDLQIDVYAPYSGGTMVHNARLLKPGFQSVWSILMPQGESPNERTSYWSVYHKETERLYIGYGIDKDQNPLNDVWGFDFNLQRWARIPISGEVISPRSGTKATLYGHYIILFGGFNNNTYYSDFHIIDLETFVCSKPKFAGNPPSARTAPMVHCINDKVFIWGGFNQDWPSELHILDINDRKWSMIPLDLTGRTGFPICPIGNKVYIVGGSKAKNAGYLVFDSETNKIQICQPTGLEVNSQIINSSAVHIGPVILQYGGKADDPYCFVYALHLKRNTWFLFHIRPDGETSSTADGNVTETGLFKVPRTLGISLIYRENERSVYGFLGLSGMVPPPIFKLQVGYPIAFINHQDDMLDMIHFD